MMLLSLSIPWGIGYRFATADDDPPVLRTPL
jgi:hypothetical protein